MVRERRHVKDVGQMGTLRAYLRRSGQDDQVKMKAKITHRIYSVVRQRWANQEFL